MVGVDVGVVEGIQIQINTNFVLLCFCWGEVVVGVVFIGVGVVVKVLFKGIQIKNTATNDSFKHVKRT